MKALLTTPDGILVTILISLVVFVIGSISVADPAGFLGFLCYAGFVVVLLGIIIGAAELTGRLLHIGE